jgi:hypothetical protein
MKKIKKRKRSGKNKKKTTGATGPAYGWRSTVPVHGWRSVCVGYQIDAESGKMVLYRFFIYSADPTSRLPRHNYFI